MRARVFNKRIEVWQALKVSDTFGGNTINETLVTTTWAKLTTQTGEEVSGLGLDYTKGTITAVVRKRNDITYNSTTLFIKYRDKKYNIVSFPTNDNFTDAYVTFIAVEQKPATFETY